MSEVKRKADSESLFDNSVSQSSLVLDGRLVFEDEDDGWE